MNLKIVHISHSDKQGGAAIAAFRHNEAFNQGDYSSKLLVINKTSGDKTVITPPINSSLIKIKKAVFNKLNQRILSSLKPYAAWSVATHGFDPKSWEVLKDADVIVIHWINGGALSINGIESILKLGKPVIWFLHDMWTFTGGCHYSLECEKYKDTCGTCPLFNNRIGSTSENDFSHVQLIRKINHWTKYTNQYVFSPSKWLADCAQNSSLFKGNKIFVFRNCVNKDKYKPISQSMARKILNLPDRKKLVLFGADSVASPYKGWNFLKGALEKLDKESVECVVFGSTGDDVKLESNIKINYVGKLFDDYSLILLYNACDVFVTPSIADNYPNVLIEAMSCGLPCVGFNIGGIPEIIEHRINGYVSQETTSEGLKEGIDWILGNDDIKNLKENARDWALENVSYESHNNAFECLLKDIRK